MNEKKKLSGENFPIHPLDSIDSFMWSGTSFSYSSLFSDEILLEIDEKMADKPSFTTSASGDIFFSCSDMREYDYE